MHDILVQGLFHVAFLLVSLGRRDLSMLPWVLIHTRMPTPGSYPDTYAYARFGATVARSWPFFQQQTPIMLDSQMYGDPDISWCSPSLLAPRNILCGNTDTITRIAK